jgi:hypothetical protein
VNLDDMGTSPARAARPVRHIEMARTALQIGYSSTATGQLCLVHQIALLLADVYGHCDKHSATLLRMSVPCYKLVLHRARSAVRASRTEPPHAAASLGVTCYLSRGQLVALRRELLEGLMT